MNPKLLINLEKIKQNAVNIKKQCDKNNIKIFGITKVTSADIKVAEKLIEAGIYGLGDSRLKNIKNLKKHFPDMPTLLVRLPMLSEISEAVNFCDYMLVSEIEAIKKIEEQSILQNKKTDIILMVDLGDLREGFWPDETDNYISFLKKLKNTKISGIGVNLACYGGVIPDENKMNELVKLKKLFEKELNINFQYVSGGNSSSLPLVLENSINPEINMLRIGEAIMLGRNVINRDPWPETFQDTFILEAEIIELKKKPSVPSGNIGQDAFGNTPVFKDRGFHHRAILAVGRQDIDVEGLIPMGDYEVLGASSDHLIIDVEKIHHNLKVGDTLKFMLSYSALLAAFTSEYVEKIYI
ncbi:MAG: alanine/ornithine racemase family PLP-dependent enzyme [Candidatus Muiribacteriota bacterium]